MEKCRACLVTGDVMQPIDDEFVYNYNILTNLDVKTSDNLYQFVCSTCLQAVKFFIDFREKCILSEASLRSNYENIKIEISADLKNVKAEYEENYQIDADESFLDPEDFDDDLKVNIKEECSEAPKKEPKIRKIKSNIKPAKKKRKYERKRPEDAESFHCGICSKEFKEKTALTEHVDSHKGTTTCFVCDEFFQEWPQLLAHRLVHLPVHKKQCHMCTRHFQKAQNLEFHYRKMHFGEKNFLMSCPNCDKKFENPTKLRKHVFSLHTDKKVCICDYCGKVAPSKHSIRTHIYSHMDVKRFFCNSCDFSCKYHSGLKDHVVRHHEPGKIYCGNCKRPFKDQTDHDRHHCEIKAPKVCPICGLQLPGTYRRHVIRRHVPSRASCNDCRRPFKDQKALDEHKCNIKSSTICPICGVKVKGSCELNRHLESHKEVGRHKCPRCPKSYKSRGGLRAHIEWHDGAPSKKCEYCSMRFYHASSLTKHRRTHTGEKPYVCKICGRGFTGNNNLKVHMKIHGQDLIVKKNKLPETIFQFT